MRLELSVAFHMKYAQNPLKGFEISRLLSTTHINVGVNESGDSGGDRHFSRTRSLDLVNPVETLSTCVVPTIKL